jgi:hypothetical protein
MHLFCYTYTFAALHGDIHVIWSPRRSLYALNIQVFHLKRNPNCNNTCKNKERQKRKIEYNKRLKIEWQKRKIEYNKRLKIERQKRKIEYNKRLKIERQKQKERISVCSHSRICNMLPTILLGIVYKLGGGGGGGARLKVHLGRQMPLHRPWLHKMLLKNMYRWLQYTIWTAIDVLAEGSFESRKTQIKQ